MHKNNKKILILFLLISLTHILIYKTINLEFIFILSLLCLFFIKLYSKDFIKENFKQSELLIPLYIELGITKKLPFTQGYAASPDLLYTIKELIQRNNPKLILEAGSGVSTLISSYSVKKYGNGKVISLDHEKYFANITKEEIKKHKLETYAKVVHAPLVDYKGKFFWYDIKTLESIESIDLLIIDGPPAKGSKNARYPAIPLLFNKLKKGAIILLDDSKRKAEKTIVSLWKKEYDCFDYQYIDNSKGAFLIKKTK